MKKVRIGVQTCDSGTEHTYPCLKYFGGVGQQPADKEFIVLFTGIDEGVVLSNGRDTSYEIGYQADDWEESRFVMVDWTFKIRNN